MPISCLTSTILIVVPAKAGTHNHRCELLSALATTGPADNIRRSVWVPAFAGTTAVSLAYSAISTGCAAGPASGRSSIVIMQMEAVVSSTAAAPNT
ncbi:hypothetical protein ACVIGB_009588 [Bradyrhizobium sp. USDA 4341]